MTYIASWESARAKARGLVAGMAFAAIALSPLAAMAVSPAHAGDAASDNFPFLMYCEFDGIIHGLYLSRIQPGGVAVYSTPDKEASLSIVISLTGKAEPVGGDWQGNCNGRTLDELRSAGQVHD